MIWRHHDVLLMKIVIRGAEKLFPRSSQRSSYLLSFSFEISGKATTIDHALTHSATQLSAYVRVFLGVKNNHLQIWNRFSQRLGPENKCVVHRASLSFLACGHDVAPSLVDDVQFCQLLKPFFSETRACLVTSDSTTKIHPTLSTLIATL